MRDFTLTLYKKFLTELIRMNYKFITFADYIQNLDKNKRTIILRHDVDKKPSRSLRTAEMENGLGIKGTYYFRVIKNDLPKKTIECVAKLGHEIGYHYDDLNVAGGDVAKALEYFNKNLARLRELAPIKTACMHGSPLSRYDNRDLWEKFDYHDFGIIGEPYFDIDFNEVLYLTDTGRMWDGESVSVRDRVASSQESVASSKKTKEIKKMKLHSTMDIIKALDNDLLPDKIMLTIHPQRWSDRFMPWTKELLWQNMKNVVKYFVARSSSQ